MKALEKDIQEALRKSAIVKKSRTKSLYGDLRVTLDRTIRLKNKARRLAREYPTEAYKNRAKELQKAVRWRLKDHMGRNGTGRQRSSTQEEQLSGTSKGRSGKENDHPTAGRRKGRKGI